MLKETVTWQDFDGNERTENFYFHLSKAELVEMETSVNGGMIKLLERIIETQDKPRVVEYIKLFMLRAYGEKTPDGRGFAKEDENGRPLYKKFMQTEAYSILFMKYASDDKAFADFVNGIVPADLVKQIQANSANN
jgi:hypothetical protein